MRVTVQVLGSLVKSGVVSNPSLSIPASHPAIARICQATVDPRSSDELVPTGAVPAVQVVIPGSSVEEIAARPSDQDVVALGAGYDVVPLPAVQHIVAQRATHVVISRAAEDVRSPVGRAVKEIVSLVTED